MKIAIGCLANNGRTLKNVLLQSEQLSNRIYLCNDSTSAAQGWNGLLAVMREDVAVLCHQDIYLPPGWFKTLEKRLSELPDSWMVVGFFGINEAGEYCGKIHDRRVPMPMVTKHKLPCKSLSVDGCCMVVKRGFAFAEELEGYDLYDTYAALKAREDGGTVWIIDCMPEHYPTRSWDWKPDKVFMKNWNWLKKRFPNDKVISTCYSD